MEIPAYWLEILVLVLGIAILMLEAFMDKADKRLFAYAGMAGLGVIFLLSFFVDTESARSGGLWNFYTDDGLAMFFKQIFLATTIVILVMAIDYEEVIKKYIFGVTPQAGVGEFYTLPIFTCAGLMWMASANDFILIFVSLELVTISFYVLVAYTRRHPGALEAGVKYLILGALSTGFLVYGITWIFGVTGQTNLNLIAETLIGGEVYIIPLLFGFVLVMIALGFKIAAVPFQIWVPDVYQGAPTPVTAFLAVASKAAGFVVLIRVLDAFMVWPEIQPKVVLLVSALAFLTLIYGNWAALPQTNLKRLLAYSSIAHAGFLLMGVAGSALAAVSFYLFAYMLMTLLAFVIMIVVANVTQSDDIAAYRGLGKRAPLLAFGMLTAMLSLAGIPFTAGFFGKLLVFEAALNAGHYYLIAVGIIGVGAGLYYYLKVVRAMYWDEAPLDSPAIPVSALTRITIVLLIALVFIFGIYPGPVLEPVTHLTSAELAAVQPLD